MAEIRTRIAPSPTGFLHVGTARAALFNELFARGQQGKFIVRIEDTDKQRSKAEYEQNILAGLQWLGLVWDEGPDIGGPYGPYRQSERRATYRQALEQLLQKGLAYQVPEGQAIKLKVGSQVVEFVDLIRGDMRVSSEAWGEDFVIARSLDDPVFHLAVVVDDALMKISHVIRGEDHLSNTARHILLQRALGYETPQYAHLPLLLDEQRRKLSKREGAADLLQLKARGFLPDAVLNYLSLLGWNPKNDQEFWTKEDLIKRFSLAGVQKNGAIFSEQKLIALNRHYLGKLSPAQLWDLAWPVMQKRYQLKADDQKDKNFWLQALRTEQARAESLEGLAEAMAFFVDLEDYPAQRLVWRKSDRQKTSIYLREFYEYLKKFPSEDFNEKKLHQNILGMVEERQWGRGDALWPLRVAVTGKEKSPTPFEVMAALGKEKSLERLAAAIRKLQ